LGRRRVVITGIGVVAPNGIGKDVFWRNLVAGRSAIGCVSAFDASSFPCKVAAEVRDFRPRDFMSVRSAKSVGRFSHFAVAAARLAVDDAKLSSADLSQAALCQGTSAQGTSDLIETSFKGYLVHGWQSVAPSAGLEYIAEAATAHTRAELHIEGPRLTVSSACCTGIDALGWSVDQIQQGRVKIALAGAAEAPLSEFVLSPFMSAGLLNTWMGDPLRASRPYDALHCGFVPAEGAATIVLEEMDSALERGAPVYAEVLGYATASEGAGKSREDVYAKALCEAILMALDRSAVRSVDYICAHGNSVPFDDQGEAAAIHAVFGRAAYSIPISSIKSMIGQPFAASGVLQAAATALAIETAVVPPTINYETPDPLCDLDYVPNRSRVVRIRHALFHSHSLGGHLLGAHAAMVMAQFPCDGEP
jgi:3-oxoacyl-[acyl-carrier-protein] synthase II